MAGKKIILVVDDSKINRNILKKILSDNYDVREAENGAQAFAYLKTNNLSTAAVLLDIVMPVMDGFEFLKKYENDSDINNIPVIVTTGNSDRDNEKKALENGAWDFVSKPYDVDIIKFRLENVIERSQLALFEKVRYMAEFDELTGIYSKQKFYSATETMLEANPDDRFIFGRFDINSFSLINSFFGTANGDNLLRFIAECLKQFAEKSDMCTYGRINADIFSLCCKCSGPDEMVMQWKKWNTAFKKYSIDWNIVSTAGFYIIDDKTISAEKIYNRASLAAKSVKGNYLENYAFFDKSMEENLQIEQNIINEMEAALAQKQFVVYYQPKYDIIERKPAGAEALVRWVHPEKGLVSPGVFIPVFERNGFICTLDYYVWEMVCRQIREWIENGKRVLPVSVNVSRVNMYNPQLAEKICSLVDSYAIPHGLFNIEITESACSAENSYFHSTVDKLKKMGFLVFMDDFGSAYSSLNVLKDVPVDVLKIDMRFMEATKEAGRAETIIVSVVKMAKWLNMPVIAEGVATKEQVDFLRRIGCEFVQGFYFAKPMPIEDYESLLAKDTAFIDNSGTVKSKNNMWESLEGLTQSVENCNLPMAVFEHKDEYMNIITMNRYFSAVFQKSIVPANKRRMEITRELLNSAEFGAHFDEISDGKRMLEFEHSLTDDFGEERKLCFNLMLYGDVCGHDIIIAAVSEIIKE